MVRPNLPSSWLNAYFGTTDVSLRKKWPCITFILHDLLWRGSRRTGAHLQQSGKYASLSASALAEQRSVFACAFDLQHIPRCTMCTLVYDQVLQAARCVSTSKAVQSSLHCQRLRSGSTAWQAPLAMQRALSY